MDEEAKKIILARRARFIAAALAGVGFATHACGGESTRDGGDEGMGGSAATSSGGVNSGGTGAQPCLSLPAGSAEWLARSLACPPVAPAAPSLVSVHRSAVTAASRAPASCRGAVPGPVAPSRWAVRVAKAKAAEKRGCPPVRRAWRLRACRY